MRRLSTARSLEEVTYIVTQAARTLLAADGVTFVLRDGDHCYYADEDAISPLWKGRRFPMSACISGWCMTEGMAAVVPDIYQDARIPVDAYRPTFVRSLAMVPVRQEEPIAALGAYWSSLHATTAYELECLQTVANAAALGVAYVQVQQERANALKSLQLVSEMEKERRRFLGELQSRARDSLDIVRMIVGLNQGERSKDGEKIGRRVAALMSAHELIAQAGFNGADLKDLLLSELKLFDSASVCVQGEPVLVSPICAKVLALVFHELARNAADHGALSESGRLSSRGR